MGALPLFLGVIKAIGDQAATTAGSLNDLADASRNVTDSKIGVTTNLIIGRIDGIVRASDAAARRATEILVDVSDIAESAERKLARHGEAIVRDFTAVGKNVSSTVSTVVKAVDDADKSIRKSVSASDKAIQELRQSNPQVAAYLDATVEAIKKLRQLTSGSYRPQFGEDVNREVIELTDAIRIGKQIVQTLGGSIGQKIDWAGIERSIASTTGQSKILGKVPTGSTGMTGSPYPEECDCGDLGIGVATGKL